MNADPILVLVDEKGHPAALHKRRIEPCRLLGVHVHEAARIAGAIQVRETWLGIPLQKSD